MSVAVSSIQRPQALIEASQAVRKMLGNPRAVPYRGREVVRAKIKIGDSLPAVIAPGSRIGLPWHAQEIDFLERNAGVLTVAQIALALGRSETSIKHKSYRYGWRVMVRKAPAPVDPRRVKRAESVYSRCFPAMRSILHDVARERGVVLEDMLNPGGKWPAVHARQHAIWRMVRDTSLSMSQIGVRLRLDHTTVRHAVLVEDRRQGTNVHAKVAAKRGQS